MNEQTRPTHLAPPPSDTEFEQAQPAPPPQPPAVRAHDPEPTGATALPSRAVPFVPANSPFGKVVEAIANVMAEIKPVEKLGWNKFHNYAHMRIGDLNTELTPLMGKHGIIVVQNETRRDVFDNGAVLAVQYEFTILHKSGEVYPERPVITGVARCRTTKESWDDKTFNKCHTAARKYFLIGLFQIPVSDEDDADADHGSDGPQRQQQRPTRRPPSPDGKPTPDVISIVDREPPAEWAKRFKEACGKSDSPATIQKWYQANIAIFEKLKRADETVYNDMIDFMDQLEVKLHGSKAEEKQPEPPKVDPISSGPQRAPRQRRPPPPKDEPSPETVEGTDTTDEAKLWLESLENAFSACEDASSLAEAQAKHMPVSRKAEFSQEVWSEALRKVRSHLARFDGDAA